MVSGGDDVRRSGGTTWTPSPVGFPDNELLGIWGVSADEVFVVGRQNFAGGLARAFHGTTGAWTPLLAPELTDVALLAVSGTTADDAIAVGGGGTILRRSATEPTTMLREDSGTTETLRSVWAASATEAFAVGDNGTILHWDGTAWSSMTDAADPWVGYRLYGVWGSSATKVFAVGDSAMLLRYDGTSWRPVTVDVLADLIAVWGSSASNVFVAADDRSGMILHRCGSVW